MERSPSDHDINGVRVILDDIQDYNDAHNYTPDFVSWQPLYDLFIIKGEMVITIEIAGVKPKDFSIHVARNYLIIDGTRKSSEILSKEGCKFHNIEIPYGSFYRRMDFPLPVEPRQYQYSLDNGILTLRFPIEREKIIPIEDG
jgi:HSP20 family molecular chaperone IbpA